MATGKSRDAGNTSHATYQLVPDAALGRPAAAAEEERAIVRPVKAVDGERLGRM